MQKHVYFNETLIIDKTDSQKNSKSILRKPKYLAEEKIDNSHSFLQKSEKESMWEINIISLFVNQNSVTRTDSFAKKKSKTSKKLLYTNSLTHIYDVVESNFHIIHMGL
jgi:hypothetical protein